MVYDALRYFCTVAEEMNITHAAERLHMSQQTLSNQIAKLEEDYNCAFFDRKPKLHLTEAGISFYEHAKKTLESESILKKHFEELKGRRSGHLSLGITQTRSQTFLPDILPEFVRKNPGIKLDVNICHISELEKKLTQGDLDLIILPNNPSPEQNPDLESIVVAYDRLCLLIPLTYLKRYFNPEKFEQLPLERKWKEILETPLLTELPYVLSGPKLSKKVKEFFAQYVPSPTVLAELHNTEVLFTLPFSEVGAVFSFESIVKRLCSEDRLPFVMLPLEGSNNIFPLSAVFSKKRGLTWTAQVFLDCALSHS